MQESLELAALPYQDPPIKTILILSSFLLLLNAINRVLDNLIYCGLVGQVLIGVAFGTPGAKWLDKGTEQVIVQLGYLGLVLLVYQGGLNTNFKSLKANVGISALVALIGICSPIGFAFSLPSLASATPLQSFAAGAALCSTSLGTTFSILSSSGLTNTRLGTVLTSAAMMDDVVGLVLVQVISKLGSNPSSFHTITVVRPIAGSVGLALLVFLTCRYLVEPFSFSMGSLCPSTVMRVVRKHPNKASLIAHVAFLLGIVAAASYIGTSNLFAAYLAGASISWYYSEVAQVGNVRNDFRTEVPQSIVNAPVQQAAQSETSGSQAENSGNHDHCTDRGAQPNTPAASSTLATHEADGQMRVTEQMQKSLTGVSVYNSYIEQPFARLLKPFFFASARKVK